MVCDERLLIHTCSRTRLHILRRRVSKDAVSYTRVQTYTSTLLTLFFMDNIQRLNRQYQTSLRLGVVTNRIYFGSFVTRGLPNAPYPASYQPEYPEPSTACPLSARLVSIPLFPGRSRTEPARRAELFSSSERCHCLPAPV
jgi:hypothetical protein